MWIRLPSRPELWSPSVREALQAAHQVWALGDVSFAPAKPFAGSMSIGDLLAIPMHPMEELVLLVDRLLGPGGCPWDQEQTHASLKRCLLEETYEVLEAIDSENPASMQEELGDLLLQPIMHGQIAVGFDTKDLTNGIIDKLIHRHPHVFGSVVAEDSAEVLKNWEVLKKAEKGERKSALDGVPAAAPSLMRALEISKKAAKEGFEWPSIDGVWEKVHEEIGELKAATSPEDQASELGDLLFTVVNIARWLKVDPEDALRVMVNRFMGRFQAMEKMAEIPLKELSLEAWDDLWNRAKFDTVSGISDQDRV